MSTLIFAELEGEKELLSVFQRFIYEYVQTVCDLFMTFFKSFCSLFHTSVVLYTCFFIMYNLFFYKVVFYMYNARTYVSTCLCITLTIMYDI